MIAVRILRDLTLAQPLYGTPHISAASGLVRLGEVLFVVADDSQHLGVFPAGGQEPGRSIPIFDRELSDDPEERAKHKGDVEAIVCLPPHGDLDRGALLALGSGSGPGRDEASLVPLEDHTEAGDGHRPLSLTPLYDALRRDIPALNIEGATIASRALHLFHRGDNEGNASARIEVDLEAVSDCLAAGRSPDPDMVAGITTYDLGRHAGINLNFSDASTLEDGRVMFAASAEETRSGLPDKYVGSALGMLGRDLELQWCEPVDAPAKLEGLTVRIVGEAIEVLMVSDGDDPEVPSPLYESRLPLRAAIDETG